jgi:hypothetical protein
MSIPLPNIISGATALLQPVSASTVSNPDPDDSKPFVVCVTRDIPEDVMSVLSSFGAVKTYDHDIHANVDPTTMAFQYMVIDFRSASDRLYFQQYIQPQGQAYHQILYCWAWEMDGVPVAFESQFDEWPKVQANRAKYDALLLTPPIPKPSCLKSFLVKLLNGFSK